MASVLKGAVGSLTGGVEKGYLLIKRANTKPDEPQSTVMPQESGSSASSKLAAVKNAGKKISQKAEQKLSAASNVLKGMSSHVAANAGDYVPLQLQYNPSSIQMSTIKGTILNRSAGGGAENTYQQWTVPVQTTMSVDLIFDDMNIMDAFNMENLVSVSAVRDVGKQMAQKEFSVRPLVDALVGAMLSSESQRVVFVWNEMAFDGSLVNVDTTYTMFNRSGEPIRAKVSIQIFQQNESGDKKTQENLDYWKQAYNRMFTTNYMGGGSNAMKNLNKVSNFINL